jgi:ankyrin repeat protein
VRFRPEVLPYLTLAKSIEPEVWNAALQLVLRHTDPRSTVSLREVYQLIPLCSLESAKMLLQAVPMQRRRGAATRALVALCQSAVEKVDVAEFLLSFRGEGESMAFPRWVGVLHAVCSRSGSTPMARLLVEAGENPNVKNYGNQTPLHLACRAANADTATYLLLVGADVNAVAETGYTPLHEASVAGSARIVQLLIDAGAGVAAETSDGTRPLHAAAQSHDADTVRCLLRYEADVHARTYSEKTALWFACRGKSETPTDPVPVLQTLLEAGADVNAQDADGATPLAVAAEESIRAVDWLLQNGADVNPDVSPIKAPVYAACRSDEPDSVHNLRMLLDAGAHMQSVYLMRGVVRTYNDDVAAEKMQVILQAGADINEWDASKPHPVLELMAKGFFATAAVLVQAGIRMDAEVWGAVCARMPTDVLAAAVHERTEWGPDTREATRHPTPPPFEEFDMQLFTENAAAVRNQSVWSRTRQRLTQFRRRERHLRREARELAAGMWSSAAVQRRVEAPGPSGGIKRARSPMPDAEVPRETSRARSAAAAPARPQRVGGVKRGAPGSVAAWGSSRQRSRRRGLLAAALLADDSDSDASD